MAEIIEIANLQINPNLSAVELQEVIDALLTLSSAIDEADYQASGTQQPHPDALKLDAAIEVISEIIDLVEAA